MKQTVVGDVAVFEEERGIVIIDYGTTLTTAELVQDVLDRLRELWGEDRVAIVVKVSSATDLAQIGRVVSADQVSDFILAGAIVTPGKAAELIGNLYMRFQKTPYPQRQFTDAETALNWLRQQIALDEQAQSVAN